MARTLSRRGFMGLFGAAGVVAATNPTYFLPPIGGWKSDLIVNPWNMSANSGSFQFRHYDTWIMASYFTDTPLQKHFKEIHEREQAAFYGNRKPLD